MNNRFHVPMPEAGADAFLYFDNQALEALSAAYGSNWLQIAHLGLGGGSPNIVAAALRCALKNEDEHGWDDLPWGLSLQEIGARLSDALALVITGKTIAEMAAEAAKQARLEARKAAAAK